MANNGWQHSASTRHASDWSHRVRSPSTTPGLQEVRDAAYDLADHARHTPGSSGPVFHSVAEIVFIGTAVLTGTLALIHLWKALYPPQHAPHQDHAGQESAERSHPHRQHQGRG
jgi:hypothetical protein